jgi:flagellar basal body P-ring formation protein FlgA
MRPLFVVLALLAMPLQAEVVVPSRTIPAEDVIGPDDLTLRDLVVPGAIEDASLLIGMEARIALFSGQPIRPEDVGIPAIVQRNQVVPLVYQQGAIFISTDGRALERAGPGDLIRVMNLGSRTTVTARIGVDGAAYVSQ